jgi:hypothetical protein
MPLRHSLETLADPFPARDVEWRVQTSGKTGDKPWVRVLAYIDNRALMERLDEVCGPENWRNDYKVGPGGGILCGLSLLVPRDESSEWVTKWDGAENTDIEGVKGGLSGAMKRAGYQWGIGRYLYNLEEGFAVIGPNGAHYLKPDPSKHGPALKWNPPALPAWALPGGSGKPGVANAPKAAQAQAVLTKAEPARLPGAPKQLHGHGGQLIADVPTPALEIILQDLRTLEPQARAKFDATIEAIGDVLAERASKLQAVA